MDVDFVSVVMGNIEEAAVSAYSINLYVTKISEFYREIMQEGLLRKIRGLNFQHCSTKNCLKNIQKFIVKDCKATQESIRERVRSISSIYVVCFLTHLISARYDQAVLQRKISSEISSLKNKIACSIKQDHHSGNDLKALDVFKNEAKNFQQRLKNTEFDVEEEEIKEDIEDYIGGFD